MDKRLFALGLLTVVLYAQTASYPYVYEDKNDLETFTHPWPLRGDTLRIAFQHPNRILRDASFALSGTNPTSAHLGNVIVHLVNGLLVYAVASPLVSPTGAVLAAGLFWLHPVQVESVAYISSRADLVATMFLLLAVLSRSRWWLSMGMALCAVLAKETFVMAFVIPAVMAWLDRRHRVIWGVWFAVVIGVVAYGASSVGQMPSVSLAGRTLAQITRLLLLIPLPMGLSIEHDWFLITPAVVFLCFCLWCVVVAVAALRGWPRWSVALGVVGVFLLPRFVVPSPEGLHEHHVYAPMIALSVWMGSLVKGRAGCVDTSSRARLAC